MSYAKTVKIKDGDDFRVINESDFNQNLHELSEGEILSTGPIAVSVNVGIMPEQQAIIDEAKAECKKVIAENEELQMQLATSKGNFIAFQNDVDAMQKRMAELEPVSVVKKPTTAELKASKAEQPKE